MARQQNPEAVARATGRPWAEWMSILDRAGALTLAHKDIARLVLEHMPAGVSNPQWWAQSTAVAYEQHRGLRTPGQSSGGDHQVAVTKTFDGHRDAALMAWQDHMRGRTEFDDVVFGAEPSVTSTAKWHYWRVALTDGTRVSVNIADKASNTGTKSSVSINHTKLPDAAARERWRMFWKNESAQL